MKETKILTLSFIYDEQHILLAMKKRGFGAGRWNGYGGKVQAYETIEEGAKRETKEEIGVLVKDLEKRAIIRFDSEKFDKIQEVHVFKILSYEGVPKETEEMKPQRYSIKNIPYNEMWPDDVYWLPKFIEGKTFEGKFKFGKNDKVIHHAIKYKKVK